LSFAVITDRKGKKKLYKYFDYVIEIVPMGKVFLYLLTVGKEQGFQNRCFQKKQKRSMG
jgi:hypothetical protein